MSDYSGQFHIDSDLRRDFAAFCRMRALHRLLSAYLLSAVLLFFLFFYGRTAFVSGVSVFVFVSCVLWRLDGLRRDRYIRTTDETVSYVFCRDCLVYCRRGVSVVPYSSVMDVVSYGGGLFLSYLDGTEQRFLVFRGDEDLKRAVVDACGIYLKKKKNPGWDFSVGLREVIEV